MRIEIIAKNYKPADRLKEVIENKLEKFQRYFESDALAKVVLKQVNEDKYAMEITISFAGVIVRSEVVTDNMYDNIDIVLPKIEGQIRKYRTKLGKKLKESGFDTASLYEEVKVEPYKEIARVKQTELREMSVKDAVEDMELIGHSFYAFINADTKLVNIIYRRDAGGVGLLDLIY